MGYTVRQIATALGKTPQRINERARKEGWTPDAGRIQGGGREYSLSNLPKSVRDAVREWELGILMSATVDKVQSPATVEKTQPPAISEHVDTSQLTRKQREVMCARLAFVREIERLAATGLAKVAIRNNCESACNNDPPLAVIGIEN